MKEAFRNQRVSPRKRLDIRIINDVLEEYRAMGYRLTLRQLFYQLVARDRIPNTLRQYSWLSQTCVFGRMNGLIDWDAIEDRLRKPDLQYYVSSISDALKDTIDQYKLDRQEEQPFNLEIWTEKDAVSNILRRVAYTYHIRLMVNRGYSSCSAMYEAANRMKNVLASTKILYVGDHDPSGLDMLRDINERLHEFELLDVDVVHVALRTQHVQEYNLPPNPAKVTDPRAKTYIEIFGEESWELDALPPNILEGLVDRAVKKYLNMELFKYKLQMEAADKVTLKNMLESVSKE